MGDQLKLAKKEKGRGRGRGAGRGGGGRGRGRGRGRPLPPEIVTLDEDDDMCNMALVQAELNNSSIARAFEEINKDTHLDGFNEASGDIWIYPTNKPVRDYQYKIVRTALFHNTLVTLPTGLGKTFISAVVMYNFHRWYPTGIIVFMAPTKPLVKQQIDACHNTVGISPAKTAQLTGEISPAKREKLWNSKNVFFVTPQTILGDLERNLFPVENIRCVVVDEAHRALGNQAYVQVIAKIVASNRMFRVLALSATPGSDIPSVQNVLKNLLISRVEFRSEDSPDILPYTHTKDVEKVVVKVQGYLKHVHTEYLQIFQVYSGRLMKAGALSGRDGSSYTKYQLIKAREAFRNGRGQSISAYQKKPIEQDFYVCISLAHALEILLTHGLRTFYTFLNGVLNKEKGSNPLVQYELEKNENLRNLLDDIQKRLNISTENSTFDFDFDTSANASSLRLFSTVNDSPARRVSMNRSLTTSFSKTEEVDYTLSHPKLAKLKEIVQQHFESKLGTTTRIIIFSEFRDSVQEIGQMLNSLRPLVMPMVFFGKANTGSASKGLKQKDQMHIMQQFRSGAYNVLVSTCVGEEGLDIGEVDLIICFDTSKSPTRLIQRMGRTGRQRDGRTVFLVTEGKEERSYTASFSLHTSISKNITDPQKLEPFMYKQSPRMVPAGIEPSCYKMPIIISTEQSTPPDDVPDSDFDCDEVDTTSAKPKKVAEPLKKKGTKGQVKLKLKAQKAVKDAPKQKNTLTEMFERIANSDHGSVGKRSEQDGGSIASSTNLFSREQSPVGNMLPVSGNNDAFDYDEDIQMLVIQQQEVTNKSSKFHNVFQTNSEERKGWKPCTSFTTKNQPVSISVISELMDVGLTEDDLVLGNEALNDLVSDLQNRKSFANQNREYCDCGNTMEIRPPIDDIETLNEACNDEAGTEDSLGILGLNSVNELSSPPRVQVQSEKEGYTPSDDDSLDEIPLSPEICRNSVYERVKQNTAFKSQMKENQSISSASSMESIPLGSSTYQLQNRKEKSFDRSVYADKPQTKNTTLDTSKSIMSSAGLPPPKKPTPFQTSLNRVPNDNNDDEDDDFMPKKKIFSLPSTTTATKSFTFRSKKRKTSPSLPQTSTSSCVTIDIEDDFKIKRPSAPALPSKRSALPATSVSPMTRSVFRPPSLRLSTSPHNTSNAHNQSSFLGDSVFEATTMYSPTTSKSAEKTNRSTISQFPSSNRSTSTFSRQPESEDDSIREVSTVAANSPVMRNVFQSSRFRFATSSPSVSVCSAKSAQIGSPESPIARNDTFEGSNIESPVVATRTIKRFRSRNQFLMTQADEEADEEDDFLDDDVEGEGPDGYANDSFVTNDESFTVTETQRLMYLQSTRDLPTKPIGRIEKPLSPRYYGTSMDAGSESYDQDDSFCQNEVEYMEVGCFTQAMNQAKIEIDQDDGSNGRYKTRRAKRIQSASCEVASRGSDGKKRRRIVEIDDSDSDE